MSTGMSTGMSALVEVPVVRTLDGLAPGFRARLEAFVAACRAAGQPVRVIETLRTRERQAWLYGQGRTGVPYARPGRIVTRARWPQSMHAYGLAADVLPTRTGWQTPESVWEQLAQLAEAAGLVSGRRFKSLVDSPHVQFPLAGGGLSPSMAMIGALERGGPSAAWPLVPAALTALTPSASRAPR